MVEAVGDVLEAQRQEGEEAGGARGAAASMTVSGASGDSTAEVTAPPSVDRQQAAMGGVAVEQQARSAGAAAPGPGSRRRSGATA